MLRWVNGETTGTKLRTSASGTPILLKAQTNNHWRNLGHSFFQTISVTIISLRCSDFMIKVKSFVRSFDNRNNKAASFYLGTWSITKQWSAQAAAWWCVLLLHTIPTFQCAFILPKWSETVLPPCDSHYLPPFINFFFFI